MLRDWTHTKFKRFKECPKKFYYQEKQMSEETTTEFTLALVAPAGLKHYAPISIADEMMEGDIVTLRPEPDNEYDSMAVELYWVSVRDGVAGAPPVETKIGYIPKPLNQAILALKARGYHIWAKVAQSGDSRVRVYMEQDGGIMVEKDPHHAIAGEHGERDKS